MEQGHIDAGVVHLGDEAVGGEFQVAQVRRVELLGAVLAIGRPDDAAALAVDAEAHVGDLAESDVPLLGQGRGGGGGTVAHAPGRLVVAGVGNLHPAQVLG